jgi:hypothetical protein
MKFYAMWYQFKQVTSCFFVCSLGTKINKLKSVAFVLHSNYNFQTQESINILKTKQNKTMISRVTLQIRTNCGLNEDTK